METFEELIAKANKSDTSGMQPEGRLVADGYKANPISMTTALYLIAYLWHELNKMRDTTMEMAMGEDT